MAAQGKCSQCGAAFTFPSRPGYEPCPFCGATLQRTSASYRGAWFSISGAPFASAVACELVPAEHPDAKNPATRPAFVAEVAARHALADARRDVTWHETQAPETDRRWDIPPSARAGWLAAARRKLAEAERTHARTLAALDKAKATAPPAPAATLAYTVHTPNEGDREVWTAPDRPGQAKRAAIVYFPAAHSPNSARVDLYRAGTCTGSKTAIPLDAARFVARCQVEWEHPDDAGSIVVFASA
jgi:hypothetical protein